VGPAPRAAPAAGPGAGTEIATAGLAAGGPMRSCPERPAAALPARTLPMSLASGVPRPYVQVGCLQHIAVVFRDVLGLALLCHLEYSSEARFK
jgi:hypothetical protein